MARSLTAVDLFAGAGGLSTGLEQVGFRVVAAVERDPQAAETYATNHPMTRLLVRDVAQLDAGELLRDRRRRVDLLAAGPPCQGFSIKGQRQAAHPGNAMLDECIRLARELRPRAVLIENVQGLMSMLRGYYFDRLVTGLERLECRPGLRYDVSYAMLNAADYGLPQNRRRLFILALAPGLAWTWPLPTTQLGDLTLWDAIADLPEETAPSDAALKYRRLSNASLYARRLRAGSSKVVNHHTKKLEQLRQLRLGALQQGEDRRHLPDELQAGGHETKYRRLRASAPSPTLTAHMGKDLSDFIHPYLPRTLTVREAARVQGFPDHYEFLGSQAAQFTQVGNAVPVPLGRALADELLITLSARSKKRVAPGC